MSSKGLRSSLWLVLVLLLAHTARAQVNDAWQNAIAISDGLTAGSTVGATTGSPFGSCGGMGNDVWYSYVATCDGTATASTCPPGNASYDSVVAAWFAPLPCAVQRPHQLSCSDDACSLLRSTVTFAVLAGRTYYVSVGGYSGLTGSFTLSMSCATSAGPAPANNLCANASPLNSGSFVTSTNVGATSGGVDPVALFPCNVMAKDVWYSFTAPQHGSYVVTTCLPGTDYDTVIAVWSGATCGSLVQIGCSDDNCYLGGAGNLRSTVHFNAIGGATYHISVGGYLGGSGYFNLFLGPIGEMDLFVNSSAPGNLGFVVTRGPPNGVYFAAFTGNPGNFPSGWFFGIDIGAGELGQQLLGGFPFWGVLDACGSAGVGPFNGLPTGLALYGVALGFEIGDSVPVVISPPDSDVVQ